VLAESFIDFLEVMSQKKVLQILLSFTKQAPWSSNSFRDKFGSVHSKTAML
jgi:hypothetical protein